MEAGKLIIEDITAPSPDQKAKLIKLEGSIDENSVDKLSREIYGAISATPKKLFLLFDLEKVQYLNSKTIGYLADWHGQVTEGGGNLIIANANENIINILETVGIEELMPVFSNLEEAKSKLFT